MWYALLFRIPPCWFFDYGNIYSENVTIRKILCMHGLRRMEKTRKPTCLWWHTMTNNKWLLWMWNYLFGQLLFLVEIHYTLHYLGCFSKNLERFISQLRSFMKFHAWYMYLTCSLPIFGARRPKCVRISLISNLNNEHSAATGSIKRINILRSCSANPYPNMKDTDLWSSLF